MPIYSWFTVFKDGDFPVRYVSLPEGNAVIVYYHNLSYIYIYVYNSMLYYMIININYYYIRLDLCHCFKAWMCPMFRWSKTEKWCANHQSPLCSFAFPHAGSSPSIVPKSQEILWCHLRITYSIMWENKEKNILY